MFTNSSQMSSMPEVVLVRNKTFQRIGSLLAMGLVVVLCMIKRIGIVNISFDGLPGTALLIIAFVSGIFLATDKTTYLPFLGETIIPPSLLASKTPSDASVSLKVDDIPRNATHVMYWASESHSGIVPGPFDAYGNYSNAGIVEARVDGTATLPIRCPSQYIVRGKTLPRHVHYRAVFKTGFMGAVQTATVSCL